MNYSALLDVTGCLISLNLIDVLTVSHLNFDDSPEKLGKMRKYWEKTLKNQILGSF